jgi:hypothetical protein
MSCCRDAGEIRDTDLRAGNFPADPSQDEELQRVRRQNIIDSRVRRAEDHAKRDSISAACCGCCCCCGEDADNEDAILKRRLAAHHARERAAAGNGAAAMMTTASAEAAASKLAAEVCAQLSADPSNNALRDAVRRIDAYEAEFKPVIEGRASGSALVRDALLLRQSLQACLDGFVKCDKAAAEKHWMIAADESARLMHIVRGGKSDSALDPPLPPAGTRNYYGMRTSPPAASSSVCLPSSISLRVKAGALRIYCGLEKYEDAIALATELIDAEFERAANNAAEAQRREQQAAAERELRARQAAFATTGGARLTRNPLAGSPQPPSAKNDAAPASQSASASAPASPTVSRRVYTPMHCELYFMRGRATQLLAAQEIALFKQEAIFAAAEQRRVAQGKAPSVAASGAAAAAASSSSSSSSADFTSHRAFHGAKKSFLERARSAVADLQASIAAASAVLSSGSATVRLPESFSITAALLLLGELEKHLAFREAQRARDALVNEFCDELMRMEEEAYERRRRLVEEVETRRAARREARARAADDLRRQKELEEEDRAERAQYEEAQRQRRANEEQQRRWQQRFQNEQQQQRQQQQQQQAPQQGPADALKKAFDVLGLSIATATPDDVKHAYRKLSLKWHPDRWSGSDDENAKRQAEIKMKEINEAVQLIRGR